MRVVVKISGNLIRNANLLDTLLNTIIKLQGENREIALVPGGSVFADMVRDLQKELGFNDSIAHWMAIKAMEVYGAFIALRNSVIECVDSVEKVYAAWSKGLLPLVMPFNIIKQYGGELPHSWSVTSDAIAVFIAHLLKADIAILIKLVSGIAIDGRLAKIIKVSEFPSNQDVVDSYTPILVQKYSIPTAVVGIHRLESLNCLLNRIESLCSTEYTLIVP